MKKLPDEKYKKTFSYKLSKWFSGDDLFIGNLEMKEQKPHVESPQDMQKLKDEHNRLLSRVYDRENVQVRGFQRVYRVVSVMFCVFLLLMLLSAVSFLPTVGELHRPVNNEVYERYIEDGLSETGAVNAVSGMILDYRAFDTLGESHVLFAATIAVLILLRMDGEEEKKRQDADDWIYEPQHDMILETAARILVPMIFIFGIYVILCGHLGPGGGFAGGAICGAGLILYLNAFGFEKAERFFTARTYLVTSFLALACYTFCKAYSFYTGANGIESVIGLGTPGAILSSGLIFVLNICVGIVVTGTMYTFFVMFRKGGY